MSRYVRVCVCVVGLTVMLVSQAASQLGQDRGRRTPQPWAVADTAALAKAVEWGLIRGDDEGNIRLDKDMTRYEFAAMWVRMLERLGFDLPRADLTDVVTDVPAGHWAADSVAALAGAGLLPMTPFRDVDAFHYAAPALVATDGHRPLYLSFRGGDALDLFHPEEMGKRTAFEGLKRKMTFAGRRPDELPPFIPSLESVLRGGYGGPHAGSSLSRGKAAMQAVRFILWWETPPED